MYNFLANLRLSCRVLLSIDSHLQILCFSIRPGLLPSSNSAITMHLPTLISLLAPLASLASATALTYKLAAHEKACFFTDVQTKGSKIAFYFAVCLPLVCP